MAAAESAARQLPAIARYQIDWALVNEAAWRRSREYGYELVKGICETSEAFLREAISEWMDTGRPLDELAGELARSGMFGPARSQMIAVTEVTRAYAEGNRLAWQASGVVDRVRWQVAMDERVCPQCGPMHNRTDAVGGDFEGMGPPAHVNCLPGDTRVLAQDVTACSERWYDGDLVIVRTATGKRLACTPNHPILTPRGWVAAGLLYVGGYVVGSDASEWKRGVDLDGQNMPPRIQDIAEAFRDDGNVITVPVPTTAKDFHGDGVGSQVAVIRADGLLGDSGDAPVLQHGRKLDLEGAGVGLVGLPGERATDALLEAGLATPSGSVSGGDLGSASVGVHLRPLEEFGLAAAPNRYASLSQPMPDSTAVHTKGFGKRVHGLTSDVAGDQFAVRQLGTAGGNASGMPTLHRYTSLLQPFDDDARADAQLALDISTGAAGPVFLDEVVSVEHDLFHGCVYNLQTVSGHYSSNGIITHNCRCWIIPVVDPYGAP